MTLSTVARQALTSKFEEDGKAVHLVLGGVPYPAFAVPSWGLPMGATLVFLPEAVGEWTGTVDADPTDPEAVIEPGFYVAKWTGEKHPTDDLWMMYLNDLHDPSVPFTMPE